MGWRADSQAVCRSFYPQASDGFPELSSAVTLSFAVGWTAYIRRGAKKLHCNLTGILLGESSITMKSSVIDFYRDIVRNAASDYGLRNPAGTEAFLQMLSRTREKYDQAHWFNSEIGTLFATMSKEFGHGIGDDLTSLFELDNIDKFYSDKKKDVHIDPMFVSALWGVTPAVCMEYLKPIHASQGFLQRPAVVYGLPNPYLPMPKVTPQMLTDRQKVIDDYKSGLMTITNSGPTEFALSDPAEAALNAWEQSLDQRVRAGTLDGAAAKRGTQTALKLAIINEFDGLRVPSNLVIDEPSLSRAIAEADIYVVGAQELRNLLADNPDFAKAKRFIQMRGSTTVPDVMNACNIEIDRMRIITKSLSLRKLIDTNGDSLTWK